MKEVTESLKYDFKLIPPKIEWVKTVDDTAQKLHSDTLKKPGTAWDTQSGQIFGQREPIKKLDRTLLAENPVLNRLADAFERILDDDFSVTNDFLKEIEPTALPKAYKAIYHCIKAIYYKFLYEAKETVESDQCFYNSDKKYRELWQNLLQHCQTISNSNNENLINIINYLAEYLERDDRFLEDQNEDLINYFKTHKITSKLLEKIQAIFTSNDQSKTQSSSLNNSSSFSMAQFDEEIYRDLINLIVSRKKVGPTHLSIPSSQRNRNKSPDLLCDQLKKINHLISSFSLVQSAVGRWEIDDGNRVVEKTPSLSGVKRFFAKNPVDTQNSQITRSLDISKEYQLILELHEVLEKIEYKTIKSTAIEMLAKEILAKTSSSRKNSDGKSTFEINSSLTSLINKYTYQRSELLKQLNERQITNEKYSADLEKINRKEKKACVKIYEETKRILMDNLKIMHGNASEKDKTKLGDQIISLSSRLRKLEYDYLLPDEYKTLCDQLCRRIETANQHSSANSQNAIHRSTSSDKQPRSKKHSKHSSDANSPPEPIRSTSHNILQSHVLTKLNELTEALKNTAKELDSAIEDKAIRRKADRDNNNIYKYFFDFINTISRDQMSEETISELKIIKEEMASHSKSLRQTTYNMEDAEFAKLTINELRQIFNDYEELYQVSEEPTNKFSMLKQNSPLEHIAILLRLAANFNSVERRCGAFFSPIMPNEKIGRKLDTNEEPWVILGILTPLLETKFACVIERSSTALERFEMSPEQNKEILYMWLAAASITRQPLEIKQITQYSKLLDASVQREFENVLKKIKPIAHIDNYACFLWDVKPELKKKSARGFYFYLDKTTMNPCWKVLVHHGKNLNSEIFELSSFFDNDIELQKFIELQLTNDPILKERYVICEVITQGNEPNLLQVMEKAEKGYYFYKVQNADGMSEWRMLEAYGKKTDKVTGSDYYFPASLSKLEPELASEAELQTASNNSDQSTSIDINRFSVVQIEPVDVKKAAYINRAVSKDNKGEVIPKEQLINLRGTKVVSTEFLPEPIFPNKTPPCQIQVGSLVVKIFNACKEITPESRIVFQIPDDQLFRFYGELSLVSGGPESMRSSIDGDPDRRRSSSQGTLDSRETLPLDLDDITSSGSDSKSDNGADSKPSRSTVIKPGRFTRIFYTLFGRRQERDTKSQASGQFTMKK